MVILRYGLFEIYVGKFLVSLSLPRSDLLTPAKQL